MIKRKTTFFAAMALTFAGMFAGASPAYANSENVESTVHSVWNEPGKEFIFILNANSKECGTSMYHFDRSKENYKEMVAMVLTALATNKKIGVFLTANEKGEKCPIHYGTKRNIVSHGYVLK